MFFLVVLCYVVFRVMGWVFGSLGFRSSLFELLVCCLFWFRGLRFRLGFWFLVFRIFFRFYISWDLFVG